MGIAAVRRRRAVALISLSTLLTGTVAAPVNAKPALPAECAPIRPASEVAAGQRGNGWTVERGQQRERFRLEVLGTIEDGIAPGRDLIITEVKDTAGNDMIARAGGIWAGMSGSPVYIDGELVGAIAYGFTLAPSRIAGVTPAEDMQDVLDYGATSSETVSGPRTISVPRAMRAGLAERADVSESEASSFRRLPVPFAVSGLSTRAQQRLQDALDRRGLSAMVVPTSSATRPAGTVAFDRPEPGGNFAGVISYGDLTAAGVGTTTYVCGDDALAFGHPLTFTGRAAFGANNAEALTIVKDETLGSFKLATIAEPFGTLDQDRLTAIRADLARAPATRPITSRVTNLDSGRVRNGRTDVTMNEWVPDITAFHLLLNADSVFDQLGKGSSSVKWTVDGTRRGGAPWQLEFSNRYASLGDITFESIFQLYEHLATIQNNRFERISFTGVHVQARFDDTFKEYEIEAVEVSRNGGAFRERGRLRVRPGDDLRVRAILRQYRGDLLRVVLPLTVPADAQSGGGTLSVRGAGDGFDPCFFDPSQCEDRADSFSKLLTQLENTRRNDLLSADLDLFGFEGGQTSDSADRRMDAVVRGDFQIEVSVE